MPGKIPQKKPTKIDRTTAILCAQSSTRLGKSTLNFGATYFPLMLRSACTNTSDTAKKPRMAGTKAMPAARSVKPKLKRLMPPTGSCPIVATKSPKSTDSQPFQIVRPPTEEATARPKNTNAKISGGPIFIIAHLASGSVALIITKAEAMPPIAEHKTAAPTAFPAMPFCVIG